MARIPFTGEAQMLTQETSRLRALFANLATASSPWTEMHRRLASEIPADLAKGWNAAERVARRLRPGLRPSRFPYRPIVRRRG